MNIPAAWYLVVSAGLFGIGASGVLVRRNALMMFMCIELMLNAANLAFVTFARVLHDIGGQAIGLLRAGRRRGRGHGRARDRGRDLPAPTSAAVDDLHEMQG